MRKRMLWIVTLTLTIAIFTAKNFAIANNEVNIQINEISESEAVKDIESASWDGKEWITNEYPPRISEDGVNYIEMTGTEQVKSVLKNVSVGYLWTGSDYLVYYTSHDYRQYQNNKYLYRISSDMNKIIDTYIVPNWINYITIIDNICYIATENVYPVHISGTNRVGGERRNEFEIYYSNDFENWSKIDMDFDTNNLGYRPSLYNVANKIFVADYTNTELNQYTKQCKDIWILSENNVLKKVIYESMEPMGIGQVAGCLYTQSYTRQQNGTEIAFSLDGIYWDKIPMDDYIYIENIYEKKDNIIMQGEFNNETVYYCIDKNMFHSTILQKLTNNQLYVHLNDKILAFDDPPVIEDDSMLVPMRFLFEQMGADVEWNQETQTATATMNNTAVAFSINDTNAEVNGTAATMDVPARLINDKTMVPLRFLSEEMGYTVTWDEATRTAVIK